MSSVSESQLSTGMLIMRLGLAASLLTVALPRLLHGSRAWAPVGREIPFFSATFPNASVGLVILLIQTLGSVGLLTGYLFRLSTALLASVYALSFLNFLDNGNKTLALYAGALACIGIGLFMSGPGRFAIAVKIESKE